MPCDPRTGYGPGGLTRVAGTRRQDSCGKRCTPQGGVGAPRSIVRATIQILDTNVWKLCMCLGLPIQHFLTAPLLLAYLFTGGSPFPWCSGIHCHHICAPCVRRVAIPSALFASRCASEGSSAYTTLCYKDGVGQAGSTAWEHSPRQPRRRLDDNCTVSAALQACDSCIRKRRLRCLPLLLTSLYAADRSTSHCDFGS